MDIWHLRFSSDGRHPLFPSEVERRAAVRILFRNAGPHLVTFGIADDHAHVVLVCSRERAGKLSRAIVLGLRPLTGLGFEPVFLKPVDSRSHLLRLVRYTLEQPVRHGLVTHPALWSGSCFSDLVGARVLDGAQLGVLDVLPRYQPSDAWRAVGFPERGVVPMADRQILDAGLEALHSAAAFAACAAPSLGDRSRQAVQARAAVTRLGRRAGYRQRDIAAVLGMTREGIRRIETRDGDEALEKATRVRMAIERVVHANYRRR